MRLEIKQINDGKPEAAIIIPVADMQDEITTSCLDHLRKVTKLPLEIVLVESSGNEFAFGKSVNAGIRAAEQNQILIGLDSDAYPYPGSIEKLVSCVRNDSRVGYAAAMVYSDDVSPRVGWVLSDLPWFLCSLMRKGPTYAYRRMLMGKWWSFGVKPVSKYEEGKMVGAQTTMFALRRECYDDVGPIDERYRVSLVDVDYCFRILISKDWYLTSCPSAPIYHKYHATQHAYGWEKTYDAWRIYLENWPRARFRLVRNAAARGKFLIPKEI